MNIIQVNQTMSINRLKIPVENKFVFFSLYVYDFQ